jgi:hypothetical protein
VPGIGTIDGFCAGTHAIAICAGVVVDRHVRIDPVLVEQIDPIGPESLQRRVGDFPDVRGPAIEPCIHLGGVEEGDAAVDGRADE